MTGQWFITGTDTGAGKTSIAVALLLAARAMGKSVMAHKAIETGCSENGLGPDMQRLAKATQRPPSYSYSFIPPVAPAYAAEESGREISIPKICQEIHDLKHQSEILIVEGAGGFLVPISNTETIADLAKQCALPVVIVAPNRLGTINHTLLTIEAVRNRSLPVAAIILNDIAEDCSTQNLGNAAQIQQHSGIEVLLFPYCKTDQDLRQAGELILRELLTDTES